MVLDDEGCFYETKEALGTVNGSTAKNGGWLYSRGRRMVVQ